MNPHIPTLIERVTQIPETVVFFSSAVISFWLLFLACIYPIYATYSDYREFYRSGINSQLEMMADQLGDRNGDASNNQATLRRIHKTYPKVDDLYLIEITDEFNIRYLYRSCKLDDLIVETTDCGPRAIDKINIAGLNTNDEHVLYFGTNAFKNIDMSSGHTAFKRISTNNNTEILLGYSYDDATHTAYGYHIVKATSIAIFICTVLAGMIGFAANRFSQISHQITMDYKTLANNSMYSTDKSLGLYSKSMFKKIMEKEVSLSLRNQHNVGFLMIGIRELELSAYSENVKNTILEIVSDILHNQFRAYDIFGYYDNRYFIVMCPQNNNKDMDQLSDRVLEKLRHVHIKSDDKDVSLSIHMSVTGLNPDTDFDANIIFERLESGISDSGIAGSFIKITL